MAPPRICSVDGCGKLAIARGWCSAHHARWNRHGDPLKGGSPRRTAPKDLRGNRWCMRCHTFLPDSKEFFAAKMSRGVNENRHICIQCAKEEYREKYGWSTRTKTRQDRQMTGASAYRITPMGRARRAIRRYDKIDACDLTPEEMLAMLGAPCVYCGTTVEDRGLDRLDNALPHVKGNVHPACAACNVARGNRFTVAEMMVIGAAIATVRAARPLGYKEPILGARPTRKVHHLPA